MKNIIYLIPMLIPAALAPAQDRLSPEQLRMFESRIRPVLVEHCYECHSADSDELGGGLQLDTAVGIRTGGVSGPAIVPGKPQSSLLLLAMQHTDSELKMPPEDYGDKLPASVIADFDRWIRAGAPDPRAGTVKSPKTSEALQETQQWWAWQKPRRPEVPQVSDASWPRDSLDHFILAGLEEAGLTPSPEADRATLVRRIAFDLTGLPPTIEELETYAFSDSPAPLEDLVDKYLASESYGERMGRHWLDVARYAESSGKDINVAYPQAWRYRDYVIDAFNADMPFDQFAIEQIAGDLLRHVGDVEKGRHTIATGFLAIGAKGLNERNPMQFAADVADEQIDTLSQAFLATTIACARCHDHKFDPITQQDYTAMAGIFLSTETHFGTTGGVGGVNRSSLLGLPEGYGSLASTRKRSSAEIERMETRIQEIDAELQEYRRERLRDPDSVDAGSLVRLRQQQVRLQTELESVGEDGAAKATAMGVSDKAPPRPTFADRFRRGRTRNAPMPQRFVARANTIMDSPLLIRGEIDKPGDVVPRGLPEFLAKNFRARIDSDESGRMELARWIASDNNALTSRVIVNRVWEWGMGQGIVTTVDNFGTSGTLPSNQALLDHLAIEFVESGWSIKTLVKRIVLSSSYRQASDVRQDAFLIDPDNRLAWRAERKPLDAEELRDALLVASGQLQPTRPLGSLVAEAGDGPIGFRRGLGLSEAAIVEANPPYRSVYLPVPRNVLPESLELFDFADNSAVNGSRDLTIVPSQALYWMNNAQVEEQCQLIARDLLRSMRAGQAPAVRPSRMSFAEGRRLLDDTFEKLVLQLLSRPPLEAETLAMRQYVQEQRRQGIAFDKTWTAIVRSLVSSADFRFLR